MAEVQGIVDGILFGGVLAAVAVGFTLAFGVLDIANFAHGDFVTLGMYTGWLLFTHGSLSPLLAALACLPLGLIAGAILFYMGIGRVQRANRILQMVITLGYLLIIENLLLYFFTGAQRSIDVAASTQAVHLGQLAETVASLESFGMAMGLVAVTAVLLRYTRFGRVVRACSQSDLGARLLDLPVRRAQIVALGWSLAMAMFAGALLIQTQPALPTLGLQFTLEAFLVAVVGGLGSVGGAVIGAITYGVLSGLLSAVLQPTTAEMVTIGVLVGALALAPSGVSRIRSIARAH